MINKNIVFVFSIIIFLGCQTEVKDFSRYILIRDQYISNTAFGEKQKYYLVLLDTKQKKIYPIHQTRKDIYVNEISRYKCRDIDGFDYKYNADVFYFSPETMQLVSAKNNETESIISFFFI